MKISFWYWITRIWFIEIHLEYFALRTPLFEFWIGTFKDFYRDWLLTGWQLYYIPRWPLYEHDLIYKYQKEKIKSIITLEEYICKKY